MNKVDTTKKASTMTLVERARAAKPSHSQLNATKSTERIDLALAYGARLVTAKQCAEALGTTRTNNVCTVLSVALMSGLRTGILRVEKV